MMSEVNHLLHTLAFSCHSLRRAKVLHWSPAVKVRSKLDSLISLLGQGNSGKSKCLIYSCSLPLRHLAATRLREKRVLQQAQFWEYPGYFRMAAFLWQELEQELSFFLFPEKGWYDNGEQLLLYRLFICAMYKVSLSYSFTEQCFTCHVWHKNDAVYLDN